MNSKPTYIFRKLAYLLPNSIYLKFRNIYRLGATAIRLYNHVAQVNFELAINGILTRCFCIKKPIKNILLYNRK